MICDMCQVLKKDADFLLSSDVCYKCTYKNKLKMFSQIRKLCKWKPCKICLKQIPQGKDKYCSDECVKKSKAISNKNYWLRKITSMPVSWKI